jgi:integrase
MLYLPNLKGVKMSKLYREDEQALDLSDIRKILLAYNNRRLKAYLLVLVSGGMRAVEGLAIRLKDIDFSVSPTKIHIRKEYAKTKVARDIYISDEATQYLKHWIDWKYDNKERPRTPSSEDLVFTLHKGTNPKLFRLGKKERFTPEQIMKLIQMADSITNFKKSFNSCKLK